MVVTDSTLVKQAQNGSLEAFEVLVKRYQNKVIYFASRFIKNHQDAEDITQETFIAVYMNIAKINPQKPFSTYIFEIAKNKSISYLRKYGREVPLLDRHTVNEEEKWISKLEKAQVKKQVEAGLKKIPFRYGKILQLYYFEDFNYNKISHKLNVPLNTVRTLIRRAKIKLKQVLT